MNGRMDGYRIESTLVNNMSRLRYNTHDLVILVPTSEFDRSPSVLCVLLLSFFSLLSPTDPQPDPDLLNASPPFSSF
jgi:hypothetical protein